MITLPLNAFVEAVKHELAERIHTSVVDLVLAAARRASRLATLTVSEKESAYLEEIARDVLRGRKPVLRQTSYVLNNIPEPTEEECLAAEAAALRDHDLYCLKDQLNEVVTGLRQISDLSESEVSNLEKMLWAGAIIMDSIYKKLTELARTSPLQGNLHLTHNNDSIREHMQAATQSVIKALEEAAEEEADAAAPPVDEKLKTKLH